MSLLTWYGIGALGMIGVLFYLVRRIIVYLVLCLLAVVAFGFVTFPLLGTRPAEWVVMTIGLLLCTFGLLIVRVMLIRSVSLRLLRSIQEGQPERMNEDIGGRLADMRAFKLIEVRAGRCELSRWGRLVGGGVSAFYSLLRIAA